MSIFGGGTHTVAKSATRAMGIDLQGSQYGAPIPVVFGQNKVAGNVIWYGDFKATGHQQKQPGKGGGGGSSGTSYTYSSSFELGLCEGPATVVNVYQGASTVSLSNSGGMAFSGAVGQAPWAHLSGNAAIGYSGTALAAFQNLELGSSASLPNFNFEVAARNQFGGGIVDANPADIVTAICTDSQIGVQFNSLGDLTAFKNYCTAAGIFFSPVYNTQNPAQQTLDDLFKYANAAPYFSEGQLKVVPYGDSTLTGHGVTYTPSLTAVADLGRDDFITNGPGDPVTIKRIGPADAMNLVRIEYKDRANTYHTSAVVASIDQDVVGTGARADQSNSVDMITTAAVAQQVVQNLLQRIYYIRNTYEFQLSWRYCYLEPMDIVTLTDANTGLYLSLVRITEISEDEHGLLSVIAEEMPDGVSHGGVYATQANAGTTVDPNADPGPVDGPYLFRGPGFLVSNATPEIWCALSGNNALWAGCDVYLSHDGTSYTYLATTSRRASYGTLSNTLPSAADPDTTSAPNVLLNGPAQLLGGTAADADQFITLAMVDQEIISYQTATLASGPSYTLGYLRRGGYGSAIAAHAANAPFVRLDENILRIPVDPSQIGQTVYLKFVSFNVFGKGGRTLASETAYPYVIGTNIELPDVPVTPASFAAQSVADGVSLTWTNPNPAAVDCTSIEYATASTGPWTVLAQVGPTATSFPHHFTTGATYFYRARSRGPLVSAGFSAYTATVSNTGVNVAAIGSTANAADPAKIVNPNFAQGLTGWVPDAANQGWYAETGAYSPAPLVNTYATHAGSTINPPNTTAAQTTALRNTAFAPVTPGQVASAAVQINPVSAPTGYANVRISWRNAAQGEISVSQGNNITTATGTSRVSAVAPAGAVYAHVEVAAYNHTTGYYTFTAASWSYQPTNQSEVPNGGGHNSVTAIDGNGLALIDFTQSGHASKNVDNIADGVTYGRMKSASLTGNDFDFSKGGVNRNLGYMPDGGGRYGVHQVDVNGLAIVDFSQTGHVNKTVDYLGDGATYGRPLLGRLNGGKPWIDFSESIHANKKLDYLADTGSYAKTPAMGGSALVIPNANFLAALAPDGSVPGWAPVNGATLAYFLGTLPFGQAQCLHVTFSGSSPQGFGAQSPAYKGSPLDVYYLRTWAYADTGSAATFTIYFFDALGNYLSQTNVSTVGYGSWQQISGQVTAPAKTAQVLFRLQNLGTGGGSSYFYDVHVTRAANLDNEAVDGTVNGRMAMADVYAVSGANRVGLRVAGSGQRVGDQRNLLQRTVTNIPAKVPTTISYSASAGSPANATVSVGAFTVLAGSVSVAYSAMSCSTTGTNGTNVTYYLYFNDPAYAGGAQTLVATTNANDVYAGDGYVYVGSVTVAYPASGGGSGGGTGGGPCVCDDMSIDDDTLAGEAREGHLFDCLDLPTQGLRKFRRRLQSVEYAIVPCVRLATDAGAILECSASTPFDLIEGGMTYAPDMEGLRVMTDKGIETVTRVDDIGERRVCHIHLGGCSYAAGLDPTHRIYSHNLIAKP